MSALPSQYPEPRIEWPPVALRLRHESKGGQRATVIVEAQDDGAGLWMRSHALQLNEVLRQMGRRSKGLPVSRLHELREPFARALARVFPGQRFDVSVR